MDTSNTPLAGDSTKKVTIFCSAAEIEAKYVKVGKEFAELMVKHNYALVWGASDLGLMHVISETIKSKGGYLIGITVDFFKHLARKDTDHLVVASSLAERVRKMAELGDAIVIFPGGTGTLDELSHAFELKKHGKLDKPIVVVNIDHFYDGLYQQLQKIHSEGFLSKNIECIATFVNTADAAIEHIKAALSQSPDLTSSSESQ